MTKVFTLIIVYQVFSSIVMASNLYIDGAFQRNDAQGVEIKENGDIYILTKKSSLNGSTPGQVSYTQCNESLSNNVSVSSMSYDLSNPGSRKTYPMHRTNILSIPFKSLSNPELNGQFNLTPMTGNSDVVREIWISSCPGGPILQGKRCHSQSPDSHNIMWSQRDPFLRCVLEPNKQYYLNIRNLPTNNQCLENGRCNIYLQLYTNNKY